MRFQPSYMNVLVVMFELLLGFVVHVLVAGNSRRRSSQVYVVDS
jgi:hypothetical protein